MKLYLLKWDPIAQNNIWDCSHGFVVAARHEDEAREFAAKLHGDEGAKTWLEKERSTCVEIAKRTNLAAGVVLQDFNAA